MQVATGQVRRPKQKPAMSTRSGWVYGTVLRYFQRGMFVAGAFLTIYPIEAV
jgi:hypothetical protein